MLRLPPRQIKLPGSRRENQCAGEGTLLGADLKTFQIEEKAVLRSGAAQMTLNPTSSPQGGFHGRETPPAPNFKRQL